MRCECVYMVPCNGWCIVSGYSCIKPIILGIGSGPTATLTRIKRFHELHEYMNGCLRFKYKYEYLYKKIHAHNFLTVLDFLQETFRIWVKYPGKPQLFNLHNYFMRMTHFFWGPARWLSG